MKGRPKLARNSNFVLALPPILQALLLSPCPVLSPCSPSCCLYWGSEQLGHGQQREGPHSQGWLGTWGQQPAAQAGKGNTRAAGETGHSQKSICQMPPSKPGERRKRNHSPVPSTGQNLRALVSPLQPDSQPLQSSSTVAHRDGGCREDLRSDSVDTISREIPCQNNAMQANLWRVCCLPPQK